MNRTTLVNVNRDHAAARDAYGVSIVAKALARRAERAADAAWDAWLVRDAGAPAAIASLRASTSKPVEAFGARPFHETAALLVAMHDDGENDAERAARAFDDDGVAGVPFADRIDPRPCFIALRDDARNVNAAAREVWTTVATADEIICGLALAPDDDDGPFPAPPPRPTWKPRTIRRARR
jgi:hypothetical protein